MYLSTCACVCLLFVVTCRATPSGTSTQTDGSPFSVDEDIQRGFAAEKYLLDGAQMMYHASEQLILYKKPGGIHTAKFDFFKLNPTHVKFRKGTDRAYLRGAVGTRNLVLYIGPALYPQLTITRFEPGNGKYNLYCKVFWYMGGGSKDADYRILDTAFH